MPTQIQFAYKRPCKSSQTLGKFKLKCNKVSKFTKLWKEDAAKIYNVLQQGIWYTVWVYVVCTCVLYVMLSGLVQLEALEILNSTTEQKVRQFMEILSKDAAESLKAELVQLRQVFDDVQANADDGQLPFHREAQFSGFYWVLLLLGFCWVSCGVIGRALLNASDKYLNWKTLKNSDVFLYIALTAA